MKKKVFKKYRNEVIKLTAGVLVPAKEDPHGCYSKLVYEQRENGISIGRFKRMNRRWKRLKAVECMAGDFGWWNKYPDACIQQRIANNAVKTVSFCTMKRISK